MIWSVGCRVPTPGTSRISQPEHIWEAGGGKGRVRSRVITMKILFYGINYSPELTGAGKYSGEMAAWLVSQGHEVKVVTAPPYYPEWKVRDGYSNWWFSTEMGAGISVTRCPLFVPARPTALKRLLHLATFSLSSTLAVLSHVRWRPDVVIQVAPTLMCAPQTLLVSRLSGAVSVLHIQDYEIDALFGLDMARSGMLKRLAFYLEKKVLSAFDRVATISGQMISRAANKGVAPSKLMLVPNWSETARFVGQQRSPALLLRLGVDPAKKVLLYSGNLGEKQGLELIVEAAQCWVERPDRVFLIVGEGASKARLQESVDTLGLPNVVFAPLQPYEDLPALLASADCHLIIQKRGAADLMLPSKLTNVLAVGGNAVITADTGTSLGQLCDDYPGIAVRVDPESVQALMDGIDACLAQALPNHVAVAYANESLNKDRILTRFLSELAAAR